MKGAVEQSPGIDGHPRSRKHLRQKGRHHYRRQRRNRRHDHRQGHIRARQKCHNIGSRASGAAGDQNQSHRKGRLQLQEMGNAPSQEWHDRELRGKSHRHRLGHRQNSLEITQRESHSHAQHDGRQSPNDPGSSKPSEPRRLPQREDAARQHPDGKCIC